MNKSLTGVCADNKYSYQRLEHLAAYVRKELNLPADEAIDPLRLFEDLHDISISQRNGAEIPLRGGVVALDDSEGYARYDREKKIIEILASERIYDWLEESHPRGKYFVGHELGHCVLHTDQLIRLAQMPTNQQVALHRGRTDHQPCQDTEWQANAFASALLMPASGLAALERRRRYLDAAMIVSQFGVSLEAAGYRLKLFSERKNALLS
jgi:Zn-dependent peptidase ImmA (M78 family)